MSTSYIITASHLKIRNTHTDKKLFEYSIGGEIIITNKQELKRYMLSDQAVFLEVGRQRILNTAGEFDDFDFCFCHSVLPEEYLDVSAEKKREYITQELFHKYQYFDSFLSFLWFIRDHCSTPHIGVGYVTAQFNTISGIGQTKIMHTSDGGYYNAVFTTHELDQAMEINKAYAKVSQNHRLTKDISSTQLKNSNGGIVTGVPAELHYDDYNRIERAMMFLSLARGQYYLPYRISLYMPIFEALFANESEGVNFKVPLRMAHYLERNTDEKKKTFDLVRDAYNIRSRYLHGDTLNKGKNKSKKGYIKMEDLPKISQEIDQITRRLLTKVIKEDGEVFTNEERLADLFKSLIFCGT